MSRVDYRLAWTHLPRQSYCQGRQYRVSGALVNTDRVMNDTFWIGGDLKDWGFRDQITRAGLSVPSNHRPKATSVNPTGTASTFSPMPKAAPASFAPKSTSVSTSVILIGKPASTGSAKPNKSAKC